MMFQIGVGSRSLKYSVATSDFLEPRKTGRGNDYSASKLIQRRVFLSKPEQERLYIRWRSAPTWSTVVEEEILTRRCPINLARRGAADAGCDALIYLSFLELARVESLRVLVSRRKKSVNDSDASLHRGWLWPMEEL